MAELTERGFAKAEVAAETLRERGHAVGARYNSRHKRLIINLHTGVELTVPMRLLEGLADIDDAEALSRIEITPSGLGLHWPDLDADVYVPAMLSGVFGSRKWMAAELGRRGGKARSQAKAAAARTNGLKGGRPPKVGSNRS